MPRTEVHKFGGTSVGDAAGIQAAAAIVAGAVRQARIVVVASAMTTVTDRLVAAAAAAARGERGEGLRGLVEILALHESALAEIGGNEAADVRSELRRLVEEAEELVRAVALLHEMTPRTRDQLLAVGEKLSARLLALALRRRGVTARAMDADTFLETDGSFGEASPVTGVADRTIVAALKPLLEAGCVPVVTGFCGRAPDGATTTLGRGGSDLSATIVAAALGADEVTIWTDVDGVFSADPRVVPEARVIRQLNFREAAEMSFYGAKVLHQRTMIPVAARGIPVRTRNSFNPVHEGTIVDGRFTPGSHPVKAVTAIRGQGLVSVEGKGMAGVPGVAARLFGALAARGISVTMISQSSSESSICLAVPGDAAVEAERALKREFRSDITRADIDEIVVRRDVGLVAAVGLGMAQTPGVAARVFAALARRRINVLAIAQGSSELNITLGVDHADVAEAVRALHAEFGLDRLDTGEDTARGLDVLLVGCGKIGRALVGLLSERNAHVFERFGLHARVVAVTDRSGYLFVPAGIPAGALAAAVAAKEAGRTLREVRGALATGDPGEMVRHALTYRLSRPVLVDVTDRDGNAAVMLEALRLGCDVVTANKKPLSGPLDEFRALLGEAAASGRLLKAEATVGAGLPIVDTLEMLLAAGDRIVSAEGCLSGTLGFLMTRLEEGAALSDAVAEAVKLGYTEPDPVADLSGADVARKAVILGRLSGLALFDAPPALTGLVDPGLAGLDLPTLLAKLRAYDEPIAARVREARARGRVLRYLAKVEAGRIEVGPAEVPADSAIGMLKGTDNMIVFTSERYRTRPLVVSGPGAGVEVTAMGVLGDILRIAAERRWARA
jgi:aspartokinase/homoserine dehydrogenase 1